ncbi:hypothetical protein ACIP2X_06205 [Streptomyces sp. NPDC089424]|uniref:hypothetical protein n=1 Tax=Streptomyces sp. NPDC089424 TaxID=3365917 RepID=UPI00380B9713
MRTHLAAALSAVALTTGTLLGAPAATVHAADYPISEFDVTIGNTYTRGLITWYDRQVVVFGEHKSVSDADLASCRATRAYTLDSHDGQLGDGLSDNVVCGSSARFHFSVPADVSGGAAVVRICLTDGLHKPLRCERYGR